MKILTPIQSFLLLSSFLLGLSGFSSVWADNTPPKSDQNSAWSEVESTTKDGRILLTVDAYSPLPLETLWRMLTDYNHLKDYHPAITDSRVVQRLGDSTLVETELEKCVLFYCKHLKRVESVREQPSHQLIGITLPEASDIQYGYQHWQLRKQGKGTRLTLHSELEPKEYVIPWIEPLVVKYMLKNTTLEFLQNLETLADKAPNTWT